MSFQLSRALLLAASTVVGVSFGWGASPFEERRVLIIGIDGLRPDALAVAEVPVLKGLMETGATTFEAYAGGRVSDGSTQATSSGPGWSSILTGVWVDKHGVTNNEFTGNRFDKYPHFFQRVKELQPAATLASIVSWHPIDQAIVGPVSKHTIHRGKGVGENYAEKDRSVAEQAETYLLGEDPDVLFLHFDQVDGAGHASGFRADNPPYLAAITAVDGLIGRVLGVIEKRANRAKEQWLAIITTDHGGLEKSHGGPSEDERRIFVIVSGDGVSPNRSTRKLGHTVVPWTVFDYLKLPVAKSWGWEEKAFGLDQ